MRRILRSGRVRLLVGLGISLGLLMLLLRVVDLRGLAQALAQADFRLLPLAIGIYFCGAWVRSARWRLLLPKGSATTGTLFRALIVGFTINNLLPLRMGELARTYLLARWCRVPYGTSVAGLVVERILDGLALALLLLVALALTPAPGYLLAVGLAVGAGFFGGALLVILAAWRHESLPHLAHLLARPLPRRLGSLVERLAFGFARGLALIRGGGVLVRLFGLSLLGWLCELGVFYVLLFGFPLPATFPLALLIGSTANFATLVPSSPGYVGTFDGTLVKILSDTVNARTEVAAAYALLVHATLFVPVVIVGALILWREGLSMTQLTAAANDANQTTHPVPPEGRLAHPDAA